MWNVKHKPQMIIITLPIMIAGVHAGKFGLDYYVAPWFRNKFFKKDDIHIQRSSA